MQAVLLKSFTFIFIIVLGNVLKQKGFFDKKDSSLISKVVIKITLPCALLASATSLTFNATTIALLSLGLASNITIPSVATVFCKELGNESSIPALVNSLSIIIGIICSSAVLMLFV